ncbi:MAG TPA: dihydroneopterin aldolase [Bacillota bacterium]|nr:dihydroneopterin aldolase [Peptococcaceae bacterium MAG4]NLW38190.1 dihydroneopterin aldolase [Peptococcaceae bacterium]HPZ43529.1 dihydroneopterin aldolase [Bacillota bacterium]HQD76332.1 dihydroneopterin aldolase [Bacillota bacterium]HUM58250.1 dihydroneopterin aldolase [Bacillota bacterium]
MDKIILEGMEFYGCHGVRPEEQVLGQPFIVDVELELDLRPAGETDDPGCTVDYARVFELTRSIVEGRPLRLIESVAEAIAAAVLENFPAVAGVMIRVKKPRAPVPGHFTWMAVEIRRTR